MSACFYLTKRHIRLYFRDRSAVVFSMLSVLIVLLLMLVFLGDMNKHELINLIESMQGNISDEQAMEVIVMWTIAGMLSVNAFTVPVTMVGMFVKDREERKMDSFLATPVPRLALLGSYLLSSMLNSFLMSCLILLLSFGYVTLCGYAFLSMSQLLLVLGYLLIDILVSSVLVLIVSLFVKSDRAWGAFSTLAGTLIGFLGGIYLPMGMLPEVIQIGLKSLPFIHQSSILREIFCEQALLDSFQGLPSLAQAGYEEAMGIAITWQDQVLSTTSQCWFLCIYGIIALGCSLWILHKKKFH